MPHIDTDHEPKTSILLGHVVSWCVIVMYASALTVGSFASGLWACVGLGGAVFTALLALIVERKIAIPDPGLSLLVISALSVMALLNIQSLNVDMSWRVWINLITIFLPLAFLFNNEFLNRAQHPQLFTILPIMAMLGAFALASELYVGGPILHALKGNDASLSEYNRGMSYLVLISFPILASLWNSENRWLVVPYILVLSIPAGLTDSRASKLAFIVGLSVTLAAWYRPRITRKILTLSPLILAFWPMATQFIFLHSNAWIGHLPNSWRARVEIWDYMAYRILERPLLGFGLGTSSLLSPDYPHGDLYRFVNGPAGHPHNVVTQLWVELGLPGLVMGILAALVFLARAGRLNRTLSPFAYGAWACAITLSCIAYNFWKDSFFCALAMTGVAFVLLQRTSLTLGPSIGSGSSVHNPKNPTKIEEAFDGAANKVRF